MHEKLQQLFQDNVHAEIAFLDKLTDDEQRSLADLIQKRLDAEGGPLFSTLAMASNILPTFLKVKLAQEMLGPRVVAKMTAYVPVKQAIGMAKAMKVDFLAEVALHQQPDKAVEIVEGSPDHILLGISKNLIEKGHYEVLAEFADHISPPKLKLLAEKIGNPQGIIEVAHKMQNSQRMIDTSIQFSDHYLLELMRGISHLGYYELAARVGQGLPIERQVALLDKLDNREAAELAAHYDADTIAQIMERVDVERAVNIALLMQPELLGNLFNYMPVDLINQVLPYLDSELILKTLPHVNMKKIENNWQGLSSGAEKLVRSLAEQYEPLKSIINSI